MRLRFWRARDDLSYLPRTNGHAVDEAVIDADRILRETKRDSAEVSRVAFRLRELRESNHFADLIRATLAEHKE